jgi:hypothetical protein
MEPEKYLSREPILEDQIEVFQEEKLAWGLFWL